MIISSIMKYAFQSFLFLLQLSGLCYRLNYQIKPKIFEYNQRTNKSANQTKLQSYQPSQVINQQIKLIHRRYKPPTRQPTPTLMSSPLQSTRLKLLNSLTQQLHQINSHRQFANTDPQTGSSPLSPNIIPTSIITSSNRIISLCDKIASLYPTSQGISASRIHHLTVTASLAVTLAYVYSNCLREYARAEEVLTVRRLEIGHCLEVCLGSQGEYVASLDIRQLVHSQVRLCANLVLNLILQHKYQDAVQHFNYLVQLWHRIGSMEITHQGVAFIASIWFGTRNIQQFLAGSLAQYYQQLDHFLGQRTLTLQQALSLTHVIFNYDIFQLYNQDQHQYESYPQIFIQVLQKCNQTFMLNENYQYSYLTLRHLIQSPIQHKLKHKYQSIINQLYYENKIQDTFETQNMESIQCFRSILQTIRAVYQQNQQKIESDQLNQKRNQSNFKSNDSDTMLSKNNQSAKKYSQNLNGIMFRLIVKIQTHRIEANDFLSDSQKQFIVQNLSPMLNQNNVIIIQEMLKSQFSNRIIKQVRISCQKLQNVFKRQQKQFFNVYKLIQAKGNNNSNSFSTRKPLAVKNLNKQSQYLTHQPKHNFVINQILANHSSSYMKSAQNSTYVQRISHLPQIIISPVNFNAVSQQKKISKMVRLCQHGAFLNKRNFSSDGGEFKFIKITSSLIKWGKNPQKVQNSPQSYPLKDVKAILYGKITPNFKKYTNLQLKEQYCFSLVLQKRTLDLYCKDYSQVENWVCGITAIMKKNQYLINGYTPGKMKWRRMFAILRQNFILPLKSHQKNQFYFQNAYSLILFKQNSYKLPNKP